VLSSHPFGLGACVDVVLHRVCPSRRSLSSVLRNVTDPCDRSGACHSLFTVRSLAATGGGALMWCVKRRRVVSWLVVGRRGLHLGSWRAGSGCGGGPGRERPGPRRFALVAFALVVGQGDGVGAQGGEGGGEHGALEPLVAAVGDAPRHGSMSPISWSLVPDRRRRPAGRRCLEVLAQGLGQQGRRRPGPMIPGTCGQDLVRRVGLH